MRNSKLNLIYTAITTLLLFACSPVEINSENVQLKSTSRSSNSAIDCAHRVLNKILFKIHNSDIPYSHMFASENFELTANDMVFEIFSHSNNGQNLQKFESEASEILQTDAHLTVPLLFRIQQLKDENGENLDEAEYFYGRIWLDFWQTRKHDAFGNLEEHTYRCQFSPTWYGKTADILKIHNSVEMPLLTVNGTIAQKPESADELGFWSYPRFFVTKFDYGLYGGISPEYFDSVIFRKEL